MAVTFKRHKKETGLRSVGFPNPDVDIKENKKVCGMILAPSYLTKHNKWPIHFMIKDDSERCGWKWIVLKFQGETEQHARDFIKKNFDAIKQKYDLMYVEN